MGSGSWRVVASVVTGMTLLAMSLPVALAPAARAATTALAIPDTNYAYPSNALFVAPSGSDSAAGTSAAPLHTLGAAVAKAAAGGTIVLRAGTYRESLGIVSKRLTIQPYPHEQVWLKGSQVVSSWQSQGSTWVASNWTAQFCQTCADPSVIDPAYPNAGLPDQVFLDGVPQSQVISAAAVTPGTFYVDYQAATLTIGSNPSGHVIEASTQDSLVDLVTTAAGSIIRGVGISQYAPTWDTSVVSAAVIVDAANVLLENDVVTQSAARGVAIFKPGVVLRSTNVSVNGYTGVIGNAADNLIVQSCAISDNNTEHFSIAANSLAAAGGIKVTTSDHVLIEDSIVSGNIGNGIWADVSSYDIDVVRNLVQHSANHGISIELSGTGVVASNVVTDNAHFGIKLSGSTSIDVWNNTAANNGQSQIAVIEDPRTDTSSADLALGITWDTAKIDVGNNLLATSANTTGPMLYTLDANSPKTTSAAMMISRLDYDGWSRPNASQPLVLTNWTDASGHYANFATMSALASASGFEAHGWAQDAIVSPFFVNQVAFDYSQTTDSPGISGGGSLPAAVASALGLSPTAPVGRGALSWPSMLPVNARPLATFTTSCSSLTCAFDGSGSSDSDGTVVGYTWDFGDGTGASGSKPTHTFSKTGTFTVTLSVVDDRGTVGQRSAATSVIGPNMLPTASFTSSCSTMTCLFDGTKSVDSDGTIVAYAWTFGDGSTATGSKASHTYAVAGTYPVSLTVTDDRSGTAKATGSVAPTIAVTPSSYASDSFTRTVSGGWGTAPSGGSWATSNGALLSVSSSTGVVSAGSPGASGYAYLSGVSVTDGDTTAAFSANKAPTGSGFMANVIARRVGVNVEYRGRARIDNQGHVYVGAFKLTSSAGPVAIGAEVQVLGLSFTAGSSLLVRVQATGVNPTTVRIKAWTPGTAQPSTWAVSVTDSTAALQAKGSVGLQALLSSSATNAPVAFTWDNLAVQPSNLPPTARFTAACSSLSCSVDGSASTDPEATTLTYAWSFGDGTTGTGRTASHTYRTSGTYTITLTVTDTNGTGTKAVTTHVVTV